MKKLDYLDYNSAINRMREFNFTDADLEVITYDWPNMTEHIAWLLTATREEISDWIEVVK